MFCKDLSDALHYERRGNIRSANGIQGLREYTLLPRQLLILFYGDATGRICSILDALSTSKRTDKTDASQ